MLSRISAFTVCSLVLTLFLSSADADETAPANLGNACIACHGPAGMSFGGMPQILGLDASDIATLMRLFKNDEVVVTIMNRIAKGYSDAEIDAIARYLGAM